MSWTSWSRPWLSVAKFQGAVDDDGVGGEEAAEQMLLGGEAGGEGFVAEAALAGFVADVGAEAAEEAAVGQRGGERVAVGASSCVGSTMSWLT